MSEWITYRQPTEADGDMDGDVRTRMHPDREESLYMHWSLVGPNTPWKRRGSLVPPATPEPEPAQPEIKPPAAKIPEPIHTGAAPFYVVVASDDSGGRGNGHPMTWETQIPEGSTLQAVLQHRDRIGSRHGTTYIAECRIIPELTREVPADA